MQIFGDLNNGCGTVGEGNFQSRCLCYPIHRIAMCVRHAYQFSFRKSKGTIGKGINVFSVNAIPGRQVIHNIRPFVSTGFRIVSKIGVSEDLMVLQIRSNLIRALLPIGGIRLLIFLIFITINKIIVRFFLTYWRSIRGNGCIG